MAGELTALGPDTEIASGGGAVGDEVLAYRVVGGGTDELTLPASVTSSNAAARENGLS